VFYAHEKMEYPAAIATVTALIRVSLGVLVLASGWDLSGWPGVSIVANLVSAGILGAADDPPLSPALSRVGFPDRQVDAGDFISPDDQPAAGDVFLPHRRVVAKTDEGRHRGGVLRRSLQVH